MGTGLFGCNPIPKSGALTLMPVIPAKAGTQGFQSLAPGSPLSRGRRIWLSAGFPDSLLRRCDGISLTRLSGSVPPPSGPARRLPAGPDGPGLLILRVLRRLLDERRNLFGARLVDRVACALDLDHVAVGARGIEPLQVGIDDLVRVRHDPAALPKAFAADLPPEQAEFEAHAQMLTAAGVFTAPVTDPAWKVKPSWALVADADEIINPDLERFYAARAHSRVVVVNGASHSARSEEHTSELQSQS